MRTRIPHLALLFILVPLTAQAETGDTSYASITDTTVHWPSWDQFVRVLTLRDHNTRVVVVGTTLLGLTSGMIGTFMLLRKRALMGDALSHATLPGIGIAFIVMTACGGSGKALPGLLLGAAISGAVAIFVAAACALLFKEFAAVCFDQE